MKKLLFSVLCLLSAALRAEPIELTNADAQKLWFALNQLPEQLTGAAVYADNITALLPHVKAYEKKLGAKLRELKVTQAAIDRGDDTADVRAAKDFEDALAEEKISVDLERAEITAGEIPKIRVSVLAIVRQFLKPNPKPAAK